MYRTRACARAYAPVVSHGRTLALAALPPATSETDVSSASEAHKRGEKTTNAQRHKHEAVPVGGSRARLTQEEKKTGTNTVSSPFNPRAEMHALRITSKAGRRRAAARPHEAPTSGGNGQTGRSQGGARQRAVQFYSAEMVTQPTAHTLP